MKKQETKQEEMKAKNSAQIILASMFAIFRAFWDSTIHIVWGVATMFLLAGLIAYFKVDSSAVTMLLDLAGWLMQNWKLFWLVFFIWESYSNLKEGEVFS